ncbi:MAG: phage virion morphogenesis protein [Candidatus Accumulibacter sp.]|jgi:phage virion morphogenesis protein|nr:phage virion morphogenesis protein [Accumulibacter sp.]
MAVELIHIEADSAAVQQAFCRLQAAIGNLRPAMTDIAATLWERVEERFETRTDPVGKSWKSKKSGAPATLIDSGHMLDSLSRRADSRHAMVGFGQPYAIYHEFGTVKMDRRGLLFADPEKGELAPDDEKVILDAVLDHLSKAV